MKNRLSRAGAALLALLAYLPPLLTKPGRMPTDTKLFLYLNPGRLIGDAPFTWDTRQFGGWVPHQTIAYLWPQGPWYWCFDQLGVPDWVAHRLWIGTLLFLGGLGVMWAAKLLGLTRPGALSAGVVYMLSPYILPYVSRTSAMLLPWAALGWIVGLTILSATSGRAWRHPALLALVLLSCSAVNATAVMMIAPAPILWLVHAVLNRTITWRRALATSARIGVLAVGVSLWWIFMLRAQGAHGADVLAYSESLQATSLTSLSTETLRGMGYWLFYVRDPYAFTTTASQIYMESGRAIIVSFGLTVLCLAGLALTRWGQRRYAAALVFVGIVLAVGVHPIADASPLMKPLAEHSRSSLSLAIRSSTRALPMSNLGMALGIGALVTALGATRLRARAVAPVLVVLIAVVNLPALWDGNLVDPALERDENPPAAWIDAADHLSSTSSEYRVLQLPGSEFGAFRWGYTVDPPLPGLTTKPLVTRDLLPLGSPGVMDLLYALDDREQSRTFEPESLAAVARFLGVDTIWVADDLAYDRFRTPLPTDAAAELTGAPGTGTPTDYGSPVVNVPDIPMVDGHSLTTTAEALPPVRLVPVDDPASIVRASSRVVVLVGSGDGVVDAAAAGLLDGHEALLYAADLPTAGDQGTAPALVIVTDSNRDRAHHWRSSQDVTGFTETGGDGSDVLRPDEADQRLPVFGPTPSADDQTIATLEDGLVVKASGYGEPFAYRPEQRPAMAVDGDPDTAWVVGDRTDPIGQYLTVSATGGSLHLLQPQHTDANRMITAVRVTGEGWHRDVTLDESSLTAPTVVMLPGDGPVTITITGVGPRPGGTDTGPSAVGFAEVLSKGSEEVVRVPDSASVQSPDTPLAIVLTRLRVDPLDRWRSDPERELIRRFDVVGDRSADVTVTVRRDDRASDELLNALDGVTGPVADRRLTGSPASRGVFAADGDPATMWTSPFVDAVGSTLTWQVDGPVTELRLQQPTDQVHSVITRLRLTADGVDQTVDVPAPDANGISTLRLATPVEHGPLTVAIDAIDARTTVDRRFAEVTTLPVAIRELSGDGLVGTSRGAAPTDTCAPLLELDGSTVGVRLTAADQASLAAGEAVKGTLCDGPIDLTDGSHLVHSRALGTGLQVDRVTLTSGEVAPAAAPPTVTVSRSRTARTATVDACPQGCWLVLGEGWNPAWSASIGGRSLGAPTQIAGGFNGWWLPPNTGPTVVSMEWTAQTPVTVALVLSLLSVLVCVGLVIGRRPLSTYALRTYRAAPPRLAGLGRSSWRASAASAAACVVLAGLIASPRMAVWALVPAALVLALRRPRIATFAGVGLMALLAARVLRNQLVTRLPANAAWPMALERVHRPGMLVVALLLAGALQDDDVSDAAGSAPPPASS